MDYNNILKKDENILKIVIPRQIFNKELQDIKIIYLNIFDDKLKNICDKVESNSNITLDDKNIANSIIPYFFKKIGNIEKYIIKFFYKNISQDIHLNHFTQILAKELIDLRLINENQIDLILYSYKYNFNINDYIEFVNYLLYDKEIITGNEIIKLLKQKNILPIE